MRHIRGDSMPNPDASKNLASVKNPTILAAGGPLRTWGDGRRR
jgi:hypothetical protein